MAAIAFGPFDLWKFPNREMNPRGIKNAEISSQEMCKQCSKQKSSLAKIFFFFFNHVGFGHEQFFAPEF